MTNKIIKAIPTMLLVVLSLPLIWSLFVPGYYGASDDMHIAWLYEMHQSIMSSQFPPRYVPDLSFGFGYPLFNFVFPLPFYAGEIFHILGFSLVDSVKIVLGLSLVLSVLSMYVLLKKYSSSLAATCGALIYGYAPYRATEVYVRGAVGEAFSFVFLPLALLSAYQLTNPKADKRLWVGIGGMVLGALVLTHNITAYMFFPALTIYLIIRLCRSEWKKILVAPVAAIILGLMVSLYFWLPALLDSSLMRYDTVFNYWDHFPTIRQIITPYFGYGASVPGPYDGMSFYAGIWQLAGLLVSFVAFIAFRKKLKRDQAEIILWILIISFAAVTLMNHRSDIIWENIPFLPYFQFPWRFLTLLTFALSIPAILIDMLPGKKIIFAVLVISTLITQTKYFQPNEFLGRKDDYYLNRYIPVPEPSASYSELTEEYLRLPKAAKERPDRLYPRFYGEGDLVLLVDDMTPLNAKATIETENKSTVNYSKYFFPGWMGTINGEPLELTAGDPYGQITFIVPEGKHEVEIWFTETPLKLFLDAISFSAVLFSLGLVMYNFKNKEGADK